MRVVKERLYEDFQYDETTGHGHEMIQAEREALAFMRTVELELPKLKRESFPSSPSGCFGFAASPRTIILGSTNLRSRILSI